MKGEWIYQIEDIIEKQIKQDSTQSSTYDKILDICDEQDHQIELLNKRWEMLKDWILDTKPLVRGAMAVFTKSALLEKIQKLEKDNK